MVKIPAAQKRIFQDIFVCKKCRTKIRTQMKKILEGKVKCRRCNAKVFRPIRRK